MLYTILRYLRNFFLTSDRIDGEIKIEGGTISLPFLRDGQYFLIEGSALNDGVYTNEAILTDETFYGSAVALAIPKAFLELVSDIERYVEKEGERTGMISESFGGYSYTKATNQAGQIADWHDVFSARLAEWRKA